MLIRSCTHVCAKAAAKVRTFQLTTKYLANYFLSHVYIFTSKLLIAYLNLYELYFVDVLLFFAIVAGQDAVVNMEVGSHRLVVGNADWIVAFHYPDNFTRSRNCLFLNYFVVFDNV